MVLKYPGAKWRIADWIIGQMPLHHSYIEPYFGSGAVLFSKAPSPIETVNDLDDDVVNLFRVIRDCPAELISAVACTPYARQEYDAAFAAASGPVEQARLFLVRCWQGYGFRTGAYKAGWKNDVQGREAAYAMRNWYRLPGWIGDIVDRLKEVQIEHRPAVEVIKRFNHPNVLVYADPPYLLSTRTGKQYKYEMSEQEHVELLEALLQHKGAAMVSGYASELYDNMLAGWDRQQINTTAEKGLARTEILWVKAAK